MKYFLVAGEASGDLHAAHLMRAIEAEDPAAEFRYFGGDAMKAVGGTLLRHYRTLAFMGFIPVLMHLRTILRGMEQCREAIAAWRPDVVILVDYPGFNLKIARFVRDSGLCPVYYYISPKIWAWKERRIRDIRRNVDRLFSILPFEKDFFENKHHYPISYVGNPTVDEVEAYKANHPQPPRRRMIALLPGSRRQEIHDNLSRMLRAAAPLAARGYSLSIACAPAIADDIYINNVSEVERTLSSPLHVDLVRDNTYGLLSEAEAALVTSGTATLETALLDTPQVVCYYIPCGPVISVMRRLFLKVPYVSLVNLVCGSEVVPELVGGEMTVENVRRRLFSIIEGGTDRKAMLEGYRRMASLLGEPGAPERAAREIVGRLSEKID